MEICQKRSQRDGTFGIKIIKDFGSFDNFKAQFEAAATNVEASRMVFIGMGPKME